MNRLPLILLLFLVVSCSSRESDLQGSWKLFAHQAIYTGETITEQPELHPFDRIEFASGKVFIDGKVSTYSIAQDSLYFEIDGLMSLFLVGPPTKVAGDRDAIMLISDDFSPKDRSFYYLMRE